MSKKRVDPVYKKVKVGFSISYWIAQYLKQSVENKSELVEKLLETHISDNKDK